jgi:hypothetical protein
MFKDSPIPIWMFWRLRVEPVCNKHSYASCDMELNRGRLVPLPSSQIYGSAPRHRLVRTLHEISVFCMNIISVKLREFIYSLRSA